MPAKKTSTTKSSKPSFFSGRTAALKELSAKVFESHAPKTDGPNLRKPKIAKSTKAQRDRALAIWDEWMKEVHPTVDPNQVWVDLCREDATAMQYCKTFLQIYVETSIYQRVLLDDADDREEVEERSIKSSRSLNSFWKSLIAAADAEILLPMIGLCNAQPPYFELPHWMLAFEYNTCSSKICLIYNVGILL